MEFLTEADPDRERLRILGAQLCAGLFCRAECGGHRATGKYNGCRADCAGQAPGKLASVGRTSRCN